MSYIDSICGCCQEVGYTHAPTYTYTYTQYVYVYAIAIRIRDRVCVYTHVYTPTHTLEGDEKLKSERRHNNNNNNNNKKEAGPFLDSAFGCCKKVSASNICLVFGFRCELHLVQKVYMPT